jgi:glycosyltransferase involved in cell wall biosynthesis
MACGVPLVTTDGGALPEVVGDAGRVVPAADPQSLTRAIGDLLRLDPDERAEIGLAGRRHIEATFSWERSARATVDLYRRAIAHHDPRNRRP